MYIKMVKAQKPGLAVFFIIAALGFFYPAQKVYPAEIMDKTLSMSYSKELARQKEKEIEAARNKIIEEIKAIDADRRRLKDARRSGNKETLELVRKEANEDIEKREKTIKGLKAEIKDKWREVGELRGELQGGKVHGKYFR